MKAGIGFTVILGCICLVQSASTDAADPPKDNKIDKGWVSLFDGKSLAGWAQRNGTATYRVEGGVIIGKTAKGSPNSFLCTDKEFDNFELLFEVKVDNALNSGVQIRSQTAGGPTGRVNGPQVEIEASGQQGSLSGHVYGEAAGGWMTAKEDLKYHSHFKNDQWNQYRVLVDGPNIKTWINGTPVGDVTHAERYATHASGFIGLQVHGIPENAGPFEVRWRNIRIHPIKSNNVNGFVSLYNGKDLTGWKTTGNWLPQEDGSLLIKPREGEHGWQRYADYLWTKKTYKNFILDLEYTYPASGNSGVYFRVKDTNNPVYTGIEAQILDSSKHQGKLTPHDHGGILFTAAPAKNMSRPPNEWNRMIVTCRGNHLQVELNGEPIIDLQLDKTGLKDRPAEGYIGFQDHGQPNNLKFRNIRIKELK